MKPLLVYGTKTCADCIRTRTFLDLHHVAYTDFDIDENKAYLDEMLEISAGAKITPTVVFGDGTFLQEPTNEQLAQKLGISDTTNQKQHDVIIVGAGPTALAAAVYTTREDIDTLLFEKGVIGGLAATTDWVDNYPGFPQGVSGLDLAQNLQSQAERFGAVIELGEVTQLEPQTDNRIKLSTTSGEYYARAVLLATGSDHRKLDIPGEHEFYGRGVHYCATCDGAFYRDKRLAVVGGGNSAVQEALFLTRFASHIDLLVRSDLKASDVLIHELEKSDKITVHKGYIPKSIEGADNGVKKVVCQVGNKKVDMDCDGVFIFIGLLPNTGFLKNSAIALDAVGFIMTDNQLQTSMPGVFAAGDVRSGATMQIASAVGEGATAALRMREYLEKK